MLTVTRQILISAPKESVRLYLQDLSRLSEYEPKIDAVEVTGGEKGASFEAQGRFMAMPWRASFQVDFTRDGGYRSVMVRGPLKQMTGGFHLRPVSGGTIVTRDEQYQVPLPVKPLKPIFRSWITRSMDLQLAAVKEGAEKLNRRLQIEQLESIG